MEIDKKITTESITEQAEANIVLEQYSQLGQKTVVCLLMTGDMTEFVGDYSALPFEELDINKLKKMARISAIKKVEQHVVSIIHYNIFNQNLKIEQERLAEEEKLKKETSKKVVDEK